MDKKAQNTMFVIIGMVLLFGVVFYINVQNNLTKINSPDITAGNDVSDSVKVYIEECLSSSLKIAADKVSEQGGYYEMPDVAYNIKFSGFVPYYYDGLNNNLPSISSVESELQKSAFNNLLGCLNGFNSFTDMGVAVNMSGSKKSNVKVINHKITWDISLPVSVVSGTIKKKLESFSVQINHPLYEMHSFSLDLFDILKNDLRGVPVSDIIELQKDSSFTVDMINLKEGRVIYSVISNEDKTDELRYNYAFSYSPLGSDVI